MYEIFEKLLEMKGVTAYRVAKETGISTATLTQWKNGTSIPKSDKLQKIADYFGVTLDYLTTGNDNNGKNVILKDVYFSFAKEMQQKNISESDMQKLWQFYEMIKNK